jgi:hypothetical protein
MPSGPVRSFKESKLGFHVLKLTINGNYDAETESRKRNSYICKVSNLDGRDSKQQTFRLIIANY